MNTWIPLTVAIVSAVLSGLFAISARRSDQEAEKLRDLEQRNAERKYSTYEPMLELLREVLGPGAKPGGAKADAKFVERVSKFSQWILVWGSDDAVRTFHRFMQAAYGDAPPPVSFRMYGELVLAARRDMGYSKTDITLEHVIGQRITDAYTDQRTWDAMFLPEGDLFRKYDFDPPWTRTPAGTKDVNP